MSEMGNTHEYSLAQRNDLIVLTPPEVCRVVTFAKSMGVVISDLIPSISSARDLPSDVCEPIVVRIIQDLREEGMCVKRQHVHVPVGLGEVRRVREKGRIVVEDVLSVEGRDRGTDVIRRAIEWWHIDEEICPT